MDTIEIKNDEINVEDIMRQIRENIRKRKESGAYTQEMEELINKPLSVSVTCIDQNDIPQNLDYINRNWNVQTEYRISSHRPILSRLLVTGRKCTFQQTSLMALAHRHVFGRFLNFDTTVKHKEVIPLFPAEAVMKLPLAELGDIS